MSVPRSLDLPPELTGFRISASSGELAALLATPPPGVQLKRPVLAVPGYTGSKEDFIHLLPLLARAGHPTVAIDLRGQHESGGPDDVAAYTLEELGSDIASLLAEGEPRHVLAHSFGGLICREAILSGAPAASLTLLCSGPSALGGKRGMLVELMRPIITDGGVPAVFAATEELDAADPKKANLAPEIKEFLQRRFLASPAAALLGMGTALTTAADRVDELRASGVPVLVAYGELDDAWTAQEQADMARRLGVAPVVFDGLGHSPAVEDERLVADTLVRFWATVDKG
jgi:pimeloyl-ACP methyl ester carboxylesterase